MTLSVSTVHDWAAAAATTTTTASILALLCISSRPPLLFSTKIDKPLRLLLIRSTGGGGKVDWRIKKVHKKHTEDTSERGGESCVQMQFLNNYWRRQQMAETNFYFNTFLDVQEEEEEDKGQFRVPIFVIQLNLRETRAKLSTFQMVQLHLQHSLWLP